MAGPPGKLPQDLFQFSGIGDRFFTPTHKAMSYLRNNHMISEISPLTSSILVMGKNSLKSGLSIIRSPGKRPKGILLNQGQSNPAINIEMPTISRIFCILSSR